jgi:hypothetical protein
MKFRIFFSISKTERKLRLRFWKWDIWRLDSDFEPIAAQKDSSKAGFLSFKKKNIPDNETEQDYSKLLLQTLFYPEVERRVIKLGRRISIRALRLFAVEFEDVEIRGSFGEPFYDSVALGISGGCYYPDWEGESGNWSAKGEMILKTGIFRLFFFVFSIIYETAVLIFILWRSARLAKKNPNGEGLSKIRKWIFLKARETL